MKGTIIFDLDGTLVDSAPDIADALDELLAEYGMAPIGLEGTRKLIGHGIANLVRKAFADVGRALAGHQEADAVKRFEFHYAQRLPRKAALYPGVASALEGLERQGWRMVVCTNKLEAYSRAILEGLGIARHFAVIAGPDTFGYAKPDPRHLLHTLPGSRPSGYRCIMVGDSEVDVAAARAAGIPVIAVTYGYAKTPLAPLGPQALADAFTGVPLLVERLANEVGVDLCAP